ncbi:hypothetical protein EYF80_052158 [Liparis tanakae]|uniref:Uncharacterized protein n=1 Tax=Liparis tanakae TaxID=230148 RepID=A0A4Z2FA65_9TELE|nr:hypothetical protein EYF80_052158 [Liparis tanakae]
MKDVSAHDQEKSHHHHVTKHRIRLGQAGSASLSLKDVLNRCNDSSAFAWLQENIILMLGWTQTQLVPLQVLWLFLDQTP